MDWRMHVQEAMTNLVSSKLRSLLAVLGILVGTAAVVALISSSLLATEHALAQFKNLGTNILSVDIENASHSGQIDPALKIKLSDIQKMAQAIPQITLVAPYISLYEKIIVDGQTQNGEVVAATQALSEVAKIQLAQGRFVSTLDKGSLYCVIGSTLAEKMTHKGIRPLGRQLRVGDHYFTIIGIAKPWRMNMFLYTNLNKGMVIPLKTAAVLNESSQIRNVILRLEQQADIKQVQKSVEAYFSTRFPQYRVEFRNPEAIIKVLGNQRKTFTMLLAAIGSISLLVGGIGVMNIMLVSVVERRREIGIRMAIGAKASDIATMFLIEAIILTLFGGLIGVVVGVSISWILAVSSGWAFHLYWLPPLLGFVVSAAVGIVAGLYPSIRASRLDPIDILHE